MAAFWPTGPRPSSPNAHATTRSARVQQEDDLASVLSRQEIPDTPRGYRGMGFRLPALYGIPADQEKPAILEGLTVACPIDDEPLTGRLPCPDGIQQREGTPIP